MAGVLDTADVCSVVFGAPVSHFVLQPMVERSADRFTHHLPKMAMSNQASFAAFATPHKTSPIHRIGAVYASRFLTSTGGNFISPLFVYII